ncbi:MAG: DUF4870 domain-containing protein [Candidatus Bathyarchaeia archaeon]
MKKVKKKEKTSLGLQENTEALLCYLFTWITGLIFFLIEKKSRFVKFHAMQSLITFLSLTVVSLLFGWIPLFGWVISGLIGLLSLVLWIVLMLKAYQGENYKLPVVGEIAEKYSK